MLEVADDVQRMQVEVLCWCAVSGLLHARVVDGVMVHSGEPVIVADTAPARLPGETPGSSPAVPCQVLFRRHHVRGRLGPDGGRAEQPALR